MLLNVECTVLKRFFVEYSTNIVTVFWFLSGGNFQEDFKI